MKNRTHFLALAALGAAMLLPAAANAVTCPTDAACNGNSYSASTVNVGGRTWQTTVTVHVLASYSGGNILTDRLSALGIKNMAAAIDSGSASLVSFPGGGDNFDFYSGELNNGGAICADDASPGTKMCAWAGDNKGVALGGAGTDLTFVFQFDADAVYDTLHLKYQYINAKGKKVGSLGSFDIPVECRDCEQQAPEPGTLALLGLGMLGLGLSRRRRA